MLKLFDPQTKVQKDRVIIKETDLRMVKYSRRGIISNFLIYILCILIEGTFITEHQSLAIVLTVGLLLATLVRGYFLFRLDVIYPKGPTAWRNKYFVATLAGACWWGVILASFTLYMDMKGEASLMWLYTVVFFSTTAHAFAPYKRFLSIYQFIGLVPASLCTFFIGEYIGPFYGFILLFFYVILNHHCALMSINYWERLEAQYNLATKSMSLEEEKRDTQASVRLTNEYVQLLSLKLKNLLAVDTSATHQQKELALLSTNVNEFNSVLSKDIKIVESIFNVRHLIQSIVRGGVEAAENAGLEIESTLSPALPARMIGDSEHLSQILAIMVDSALSCNRQCALFIDSEFVRNYENSGDLVVTLSRQASYSKKSLFQSEEQTSILPSLQLVLAQGLADSFDGSLHVDEVGAVEGKFITLRCPLKVAEVGARPEYHRLAYKGRSLLLVHENPHVLNLKRLELEAMGFDVQASDDFKAAFLVLKGALAAGSAVQSVVYMGLPESEDAVGFCNGLLEHNEMKYIHQFVVCSAAGRQFFSARAVTQSPLIHYVEKPVGFFEFESAFCSVFETADYLRDADEEEQGAIEKNKDDILWLDLSKAFDYVNLYSTDLLNIECVSELKQAKKLLSERKLKLVVVDYVNEESIACIQAIRAEEVLLGVKTLVPIVGIGPQAVEVSMLVGGADHFIDVANFVRGDLPSLSFWMRGGHH